MVTNLVRPDEERLRQLAVGIAAIFVLDLLALAHHVAFLTLPRPVLGVGVFAAVVASLVVGWFRGGEHALGTKPALEGAVAAGVVLLAFVVALVLRPAAVADRAAEELVRAEFPGEEPLASCVVRADDGERRVAVVMRPTGGGGQPLDTFAVDLEAGTVRDLSREVTPEVDPAAEEARNCAFRRAETRILGR